MANKYAILISVLFGFLLLSGCSHQLEIKNLQSYQNMQMDALQKPISIGLVQAIEDIDTRLLVKGIGTSLGGYSANVILPYNPSSERKTDYVAKIEITPEYKGSGWNFLINWPGFLIWTPAWNGYVYDVNYNVRIVLTRTSDNKHIDSWTIPINLDIRHAEFDRTWTEISWLEVSLIAFVGGFFVTQYDSDITPLVVEKIERPIGDYIAQEIIQRINNFSNAGIIKQNTLTSSL